MTDNLHPLIGKRGSAHRVAVIGGGISGLSTAFRLTELAQETGLPLTVRVLEAADRLGGHIWTEKVADCLLERGPDSILTQKPEGLALCKRLGLVDDIVDLGETCGLRILHDQRILKLPDGFRAMAPTKVWPMLRSPLFSLRGKLRALFETRIKPRRGHGDESLGCFVRRRMGAEVFERVVQPIFGGIYLADANRLSLQKVMPQMAALEHQAGSLIRGLRLQAKASDAVKPGFFTVRGGLSRLVERLVERLPHDAVQTGVQLEKVSYHPERGVWRLIHRDGRVEEVDGVVFACPAYAAAELVSGTSPRLAEEMRRLKYASCATINLVYRQADVGDLPEGNGYFVASDEGKSYIACNFIKKKYPDRVPDGLTVLRAFVGGATQPAPLNYDDPALALRIHLELREALPLRAEPVTHKVNRYHRAMPQCEVGHLDYVKCLETEAARRPGLFLVGSLLGAVGIPDCIRSGESAAQQVIGFLNRAATKSTARSG